MLSCIWHPLSTNPRSGTNRLPGPDWFAAKSVRIGGKREAASREHVITGPSHVPKVNYSYICKIRAPRHCPPKYTRNLPCSTCTYISPMKKRAQPSNKPSDAGWAHLGQIDRVTIRITPNFRPMLKQPPFWDVNPRGGSRRLFAALENGGPVLPSPPRRPPPLFGLFPCSAFFPPTASGRANFC